MIQAFIKKGCFQDSVSLMLISRQLSNGCDVEEVSVMMGTPANKSLLESTGLWHPMFDDATPNDICVAIRPTADSGDVSEEIAQQLNDALASVAQASAGGQRLDVVRRWQTALAKQPEANLALISVAGDYAADLADEALNNDLNVMMFSDNVPVESEVALKKKAAKKGLLVMGPDCGTAMVAGSPLAFANVLPKGPISIVGASGTGIQELASQVCLAGQGITHALGLGGRDLSAEVGGASALSALRMMECDQETEVVAFVSKPPAPDVEQVVIQAMKEMSKPVVALFLGTRQDKPRDGNVFFANSLAEAGRLAAMLANVRQYVPACNYTAGKNILGLYTGGTLAAEAAMLAAEQLGLKVDDAHRQGVMLNDGGHLIIDLGDDHYTVGRPHPMIDPTTRTLEIEKRAVEESVGVLLLDVVIGYGATADPAAALIDAVESVKSKRQSPLHVIATVTGTQDDPQQRSKQIDTLVDAGVAVVNTLEEAVLLSEALITQQEIETAKERPSLLDGIKVVNAGLRSFADDLQSASTPVVHYQWAPIAGGNSKLASLLKQMQ
ncbi:acyl-CoA synthetase FdrA [Photobacterium sp. ZSDE20]|uniref:Acyl-CoA synthetase FdrA n=1 Tax=Photobacterium pectinilyticum TaxID=2906793 RepID=A0ABT1NA61_9GAMM|nr:acyl-CoA synthetase FdrA [Photobacterium sp. ZSDE20]MCQ1060749.1 acyl-CoA synthetase FdrA [Photobacterium sp. ZSDE20]MDD1828319.1 acyl-CoA synthetase FdrA [Photobacterium sp. ZSDE20]